MVMEKMQFNQILIYVYASFLLPGQPNQGEGWQTYSYFQLPLPI